MTDPFEGPEWERYAEDVKKNLIPRIKDSTCSMALFSGGDPDPKQAIELGYMFLLDKPIIAVVIPGAKVPDKLVRVADAIVEADPSQPEKASAAIAEALKRLGVVGDEESS